MKSLISTLSLLFFSLFCKGEIEQNTSKSLEPQFRLNGKTTQHAFGKAAAIANESTVRLERNGKVIALGAIVDSRGYILTKASSCVGARQAVASDGQSYDIRIRKREEKLDLAIYEMISSNRTFPTVKWNEGQTKKFPAWVLASSIDLSEIRVGVSSGTPRKIGREGGVMGVLLGADGKRNGGIRIAEVVPQAAAYKAGLQNNDVIVKIDGRKVVLRDQVIKLVSNKDPGDLIRVEVERKSKILTFGVTLGHRSVTFDLFNRNLQMSGPVSKRKDNFPQVLQHDLPLPKEGMGGPVFDLDGGCVGINIARIDRVTIYSLPGELVSRALINLIPEE